MKKLVILLLIAMLGVNLQSYSQAVDDRAVIPVAVTLNSILRLNVKSGGNIEFVFNTLNDYQNGIAPSAEYETVINVASSVNFRIDMYAEDSDLSGTDSLGTANTVPSTIFAYTVSGGDATSTLQGGTNQLAATTGNHIVTNNTGNAGDVSKNEFTIAWECGTTNTAPQPILGQNFPADRYATNVFFILEPDPS